MEGKKDITLEEAREMFGLKKDTFDKKLLKQVKDGSFGDEDYAMHILEKFEND